MYCRVREIASISGETNFGDKVLILWSFVTIGVSDLHIGFLRLDGLGDI
jgi:hypothetical protein